MRRYGQSDGQWERIKDLLPGREDHVGGTAADNRLFVETVLYRYCADIPGVICQSGSATGRMCIGVSAAGAKVS